MFFKKKSFVAILENMVYTEQDEQQKGIKQEEIIIFYILSVQREVIYIGLWKKKGKTRWKKLSAKKESCKMNSCNTDFLVLDTWDFFWESFFYGSTSSLGASAFFYKRINNKVS